MKKITNLTAVVGPMFSGKSGKTVKLALEAQKKGKVIAFVHEHDRGRLGDKNGIISRDDDHFPAHYISDAAGMRAILEAERPYTVCIDECQFFQGNIADEMLAYIIELCEQGLKVICSGLERTSEMKPFGLTPRIKQHADMVIELTAICYNVIKGKRCEAPATESHFLPGKKGSVSVGNNDYIAVCGACMRSLRPELFDQQGTITVADSNHIELVAS